MADELIHELSAAYALDALDPEEQEEFERHLAGCERCREDVAGFSGTTAALAFAVPPATPPSGLGDRIAVAARAERPNVVPLRPRWAMRTVASSLAAAAASVAVAVWAVGFRGSSGATALRSIPIEGASGSLVVGGKQAALVLTGLGRAPVGKTYEAWVLRDGGAVPAGIFRGGGRTTVFRLTRDVASGSMVAVTVERAGGVAKPTRTPLIVSGRV